MNSRAKLPEISPKAFTQAREKLGLSVKDLASKACLSVRQIEQIENGEMSSFYGAQVKFTAAKKVASILGLSDDEAFELIQSPALKNSLTTEPANSVVDEITKTSSPTEVLKLDKVVTAAEPKVSGTQAKVFTPKAPAKSRLIVWGGMLAALVFSAINLRPLFFTDPPAETILVKEEVIEPVSAETVNDVKNIQTSATTPEPAPITAPVLADNAAGAQCPPADAVIPSYKPSLAKKSGDMVYLQAKSQQVVCVLDASGKTQNKTVEPGLGVSFYGKPPFKVFTSGLGQVDIYFQGAKVRPENSAGKTILLEAGDLNQPAAPLDSQLR